MARLLFALSLLCLSVSALAADIRIGYIGGLTGEGSENAANALKALKLAVEDFNAKKILKEHKVHVFSFDTKSSPADAIQAFEAAKKAKLSALIGIHNSNEGLVVSKLSEKAKLPLLVTSATHPEITRNRKYTARVGFNDIAEATALSRFAINELKAKSAAIVTDVSDSFATSLSKEFERLYRTQKGSILLKHQIQTGESDFSEFIVKLQTLKKRPDFLFIATSAMDGSHLMAQMAQADLTIPVIGNDSWQSSNLKLAMTKLNEKFVPAYYATHWNSQNKNKESLSLITRFQQKYGFSLQNTDSDAALTHDAALLFLRALSKAPVNDPNVIMAAIRRESVQGATGLIEMNGSSDPKKQVNIVQLHGSDKKVGE